MAWILLKESVKIVALVLWLALNMSRASTIAQSSAVKIEHSAGSALDLLPPSENTDRPTPSSDLEPSVNR